MSLGGFPIVNRFKLEERKEELLFQACLGKPLVVYTHHTFFRGGWERFLEIVDFINQRIAPRWTDVQTLVSANYQWRMLGGHAQVRVFANETVVQVPRACAELTIVKEGMGLDPRAETLRVNGRELPWIEGNGTRLTARIRREELSTSIHVRFGPSATQPRDRAPCPPRPWSVIRRALTESRDQLLPLVRP
jgi:hypothetical protein